MIKSVFSIIACCFLTILTFAQTASRFPSQDFNHETSISSIVKTTDSQLILFWFDNDNKKLFMSKSSDNGISWTNKQQIFQNYSFGLDTIKELNVIQAATSDLILEFKLNSTANFHYYSVSTDNGITWPTLSYIRFTSAPLQSVKGFYSSLSSLSNGIVVFTHSFITGTIPKGIYYSKFQSGNWTVHQLIDSSGMWGFIFSPSPNKEMVVYVDSNGTKTDLYFRTSTDLGNSWSAKQLLLATAYSKSRPRAVKSNNGDLYIFYEELIPTSFNNFYQKEIFYIKSTDGGLSWSSPVRITKFTGDDSFFSVTNSVSDLPILTFISPRNFELNNNKFQAFLLNENEVISPPALIYNYPLPDTIPFGSSLNVNAFVDDISQIESVKLIVVSLGEIDTLEMFDDGLNQDSLAGDRIYGCTINDLNTGAYYLYVSIKNNNQLSNTFYLGRIIVPYNYGTNTYLLELNRIKLPVTNSGILADAYINGIEIGLFDEKSFLFSGGFFMAGKNQNNWWANGVASALRIADYLPGLPGYPNDPRNIIYLVKASDPPFGESWQNWSNAVLLGADFYDGNNDGIYSPVDLNQNGQWDTNEDKPDLLGDITLWCTYNDSKPSMLRRFDNVEPQGIIIQQTIFGIKPASSHPADNMFFVRYRIINNNSVSSQFDSVYFGIWMDPDIGQPLGYLDDLAASDTLLKSGYAYNDGDDSDWGINPPAVATTLLQGPVVYIPGETFIDNNSNGIYDPGTDTPIDTAYVRNGALIGIQDYPGAKNLEPSSIRHFIQSNILIGDPNSSVELIRYFLGYDSYGNLIDPCTWPYGTVIGVNCSEVNPMFMYSGDPVANIGWINISPDDQRIMTTAGPFNLTSDQPTDIWVAYVLGRGSNALNSVTLMKENIQYALETYNNNFTNLPIGVEDYNPVITDFALYQNYPNPFNPSTKIRWQSPVGSWQTLKVFDVLGNEITTLVNEYRDAGKYEIEFPGAATGHGLSLPSGVYFYQLKADNYIETKKMVLIK
ncbi:T9SS type A sorting domain-containing protein [Ignavibacterium album]|uniref:T9SS type A sorting domain-containing protein n=1 Tax=Ignavibacterium album TaxID=591197 RepID=UPI0035B928A8